jgi:hypothetical protein
LGWLFALILPLLLVRWLTRKGEPLLPPIKSFAGVGVRVILVLVLVAAVVVNLALSTFYWPPSALTRLKLRALMAERLQESGGWEAVVKDCDQIIQRPDSHTYRWFPRVPQQPQFVGPPEPLPAGLSALKPRSVHMVRHGTNQWAVTVTLHQDVFRNRFGFRVICDVPTNAPTLPEGAPVPAVRNGRQLADRVYEF